MGDRLEAIDLYDRAIANAQENQYLQEEALFCELTAKFYLEVGKDKIASVYLTDAYYAYARWRAQAKIQDLEQKYPHLLWPLVEEEQKTTLYVVYTIDKTLITTIISNGNNICSILDFSTTC
ncbi:hypothetical protein [Microcoleus sp. BROC3]|uniref:hypothetical protein n=1 Tax=Microcoleus sp. BROC3 TaxID=3055323 RepID=UPI002FCEB2A3